MMDKAAKKITPCLERISAIRAVMAGARIGKRDGELERITQKLPAMNVDFHALEEKGTPKSFNGENNEKWEEIKKAESTDLVCGLPAGWMGETEAADHARDKPVDIDAAARGKPQVSLDSESTEVEACAKNAAKEAFESDKDYAEAMANQGREAADVADLPATTMEPDERDESDELDDPDETVESDGLEWMQYFSPTERELIRSGLIKAFEAEAWKYEQEKNAAHSRGYFEGCSAVMVSMGFEAVKERFEDVTAQFQAVERVLAKAKSEIEAAEMAAIAHKMDEFAHEENRLVGPDLGKQLFQAKLARGQTLVSVETYRDLRFESVIDKLLSRALSGKLYPEQISTFLQAVANYDKALFDLKAGVEGARGRRVEAEHALKQYLYIPKAGIPSSSAPVYPLLQRVFGKEFADYMKEQGMPEVRPKAASVNEVVTAATEPTPVPASQAQPDALVMETQKTAPTPVPPRVSEEFIEGVLNNRRFQWRQSNASDTLDFTEKLEGLIAQALRGELSPGQTATLFRTIRGYDKGWAAIFSGFGKFTPRETIAHRSNLTIWSTTGNIPEAPEGSTTLGELTAVLGPEYGEAVAREMPYLLSAPAPAKPAPIVFPWRDLFDPLLSVSAPAKPAPAPAPVSKQVAVPIAKPVPAPEPAPVQPSLSNANDPD